ncbi:putative sugar ABC transporter periplasmic substrate-binding protein [Salinarchaeum sp. Harcht-Bsk1]|uniref:BMP family lipoprotein n=1 Tax=Salinarchaeum sp. Harcht-Bsk1 TaxID=1333523 RepID=UPI0003424243|nr:BMP family ABC transporter substrate-binding protein [Salinarchaeum sp. Harcht-Bsk1]AGN01244.1 putative sugar ABC transporter periplasmic substrate-binding protein [Salinarchaeum sp. Harcht-Bsk1]
MRDSTDIRRRSFIKAAGGGVALTGLAGCLDRLPGGGGGSDDFSAAIISGPGGFGDNAYNDSALQGLEQAAEENDGSVNQVQGAGGEYRSLQSQLAESSDDYDVIVCVGFYQAEALKQSADEYSDQNWMLINQGLYRESGDHYENVAGYVWGNHEMSYLAGVVAGTMTTRELTYEGNSNDPSGSTVGFVGGVDSALINAFEEAYVAGAQWADSNVDVTVGYAGSFQDPAAGREVALSQYEAGADIVYHAAAGTGPGIFQAAQEESRFAIGVDGEQSLALPDYSDVIVGSAVKDINVGTYDVSTAAYNGNWGDVSGFKTYGLEQEAVRFNKGADVGGELPSVVDENLQEATEGIVNGDITVPCSATGCQ